jgi:Leucine-rich repeat (LRR) protein
LRKIDFTGVEMGPEFIKALKNSFKLDPKCLEELILAEVKPLATMEALAEALIMSENLLYLDVNRNTFNYFSVAAFAAYLKKTEVLEYLSISQCALRGKVAEVMVDSLMLNTSLKYLDVSHNRFSSTDYILAAKLGRMVQGHLNLLHVDLSHN